MFPHKNAYPVILLPGLLGYGEWEAVNRFLPYFGMTAASAQKIINDMGLVCHTASFNVASGAWDRACELYAQLLGGTVDYGKAHSEKYGHARYGKTYTNPMLRNWGSIGKDGRIVKITLVGHGFGAVVARLFTQLMAQGSAEERAATPKEELSGLFCGGFNKIIHCVVSLAGTNGGVSVLDAADKKLPNVKEKLLKMVVAVDEIRRYKEFLDASYARRPLYVSQHRFYCITGDFSKGESLIFDEEAIRRYLSTELDNVFYEVGIDGMQKLNSMLSVQPDTYYLSATGSVTEDFLGGKLTLPLPHSGVLAPTAALIASYENYHADKATVTPVYHENDGLVSTEASLAPETEAATGFSDVSKCRPGLWYQLPVERQNHAAFIGFFRRPDKYRNYVYDMIKTISQLESV